MKTTLLLLGHTTNKNEQDSMLFHLIQNIICHNPT